MNTPPSAEFDAIVLAADCVRNDPVAVAAGVARKMPFGVRSVNGNSCAPGRRSKNGLRPVLAFRNTQNTRDMPIIPGAIPARVATIPLA